MAEGLKRKIEALLFIISKGLRSYELAEKAGATERKVKQAIDDLQKEYKERNSAFSIVNFNGLFRMSVDRNLVQGLNEIVPSEFNKSLIKTLSVVAWKQKIPQSEVVRIRGNKAYNHIEKLIELGFIVSEPFGRTQKLELSNKFFEYFNIDRGEEKEIFKDLFES